MLAFGIGGLLFYLLQDVRKAHEEAASAPWLLLYEIEDCDNIQHGHSVVEVESNILDMEKRQAESWQYLAEQRESLDDGTRF